MSTMITIYDIALRAGVSSATVSRVINGRPDVSRKTRAAILAIMDELGYRPSATARGLAMKKSKMIGVFIYDHLHSGLVHPFLQDVLSSFQRIVGDDGYDLLIFTNNSKDVQTENQFELRARQRDVDGILLFGIARDDRQLDRLVECGIPCISIDLDLYGPRAGYVTSDNVAGSTLAVQHLHAMGHRQIAFIADIFNSKPGQDRFKGFQQAMRSLGCTINPNWITQADFSESGGYDAVNKLIATGNMPTAIVCASDSMAIGAKHVLEENGFTIGKDISIIGYDDISALSYIRPGITTIKQNRMEMGKAAAKALLELIDNENAVPPILLIPPDLVMRQSVNDLNALS
ncbi:LacI family transcriptional regulator [Paenibacillus sp. CCS19]|nr:LacI family transcriptional regulator [Paenibacillus cellulosilyticus]